MLVSNVNPGRREARRKNAHALATTDLSLIGVVILLQQEGSQILGSCNPVGNSQILGNYNPTQQKWVEKKTKIINPVCWSKVFGQWLFHWCFLLYYTTMNSHSQIFKWCSPTHCTEQEEEPQCSCFILMCPYASPPLLPPSCSPSCNYLLHIMSSCIYPLNVYNVLSFCTVRERVRIHFIVCSTHITIHVTNKVSWILCDVVTPVVCGILSRSMTGLNDYWPVALTLIVMKYFLTLVMAHIKDSIDVTTMKKMGPIRQ